MVRRKHLNLKLLLYPFKILLLIKCFRIGPVTDLRSAVHIGLRPKSDEAEKRAKHTLNSVTV